MTRTSLFSLTYLQTGLPERSFLDIHSKGSREVPPTETAILRVDRCLAARMLPGPMVSATQQSFRIRRHKARTAGTRRKRDERAHGTPRFAVHPEGYDSTAPDARPQATPVGAQTPIGNKSYFHG